ncbi:hypothetical protein JAAARDRAFT_400613 [Jaapia argillacea MUCL 33604]|uniref:Uncharacterized protein n=1 Tax=Jaapia argillacea MUCL 33604 TaxID=933084 RepID=A0A067PWB3_9AGAM|nr:hypothetical protein JAAARDRAFT_400613 [Jaapia argillacea MUCL 33604]
MRGSQGFSEELSRRDISERLSLDVAALITAHLPHVACCALRRELVECLIIRDRGVWNLRQLFHHNISRPLSLPPSEADFSFSSTSHPTHALMYVRSPSSPTRFEKFRLLYGPRRMAVTSSRKGLLYGWRFVREFSGLCNDIASRASSGCEDFKT